MVIVSASSHYKLFFAEVDVQPAVARLFYGVLFLFPSRARGHYYSQGGCSSSVIKDVIDSCELKSSTGYAYFFFDGRNAEAALLAHDKLVRSIIMQLAHRCDGIPAALAEMYYQCDKGSRQPPIALLEDTLIRVLDGFDKVYIIIDALDECSERKDLVQWIQSLASRVKGKVHMMVTSRPEREISRGLGSLSNLEDVCISGQQMKPDIRCYLNARLCQSDADKWREAQKDMIKDTLESGADGM